MGRKKRPQVEVLPPSSSLVPKSLADAEGEQEFLVALQNEFELEPWLREPVEAEQIKKLQHLMHQQVFAHYFIEYGCYKCETHDYPHAGNALCKRCRKQFLDRLKSIRKQLSTT